MTTRIPVARTAKMLIGGSFVRSESARTYEVCSPEGAFVGNVPSATRKDVRDAVLAARKGFREWDGLSHYNRSQVIYRMAEMMEVRREQFALEVSLSEGMGTPESMEAVDLAIDSLVWFAGWCDKLPQVLSSFNPVPYPHNSSTTTVPAGLVASVAPVESSLVGLVCSVAAPLAAGCSVVVLSSEDRPFPAVTFSEVVAVSDVPAGAVNILTGAQADVVPFFASHADVDVLDLRGVTDASLATQAEREASATVKRVITPARNEGLCGLGLMRCFVEAQTVWSTSGK